MPDTTMPDTTRPQPEPRSRYRRFTRIATRWNDNDGYNHVNNAIYYSFFDTTITRLMIEQTDFDLATSPVIGLVVESGCRYFAPLAFPDEIDVGLRVGSLGSSSVRYELGLFRGDATHTSAQGHFVHVMVGRADNRPLPIPPALRAVLAALMIP